MSDIINPKNEQFVIRAISIHGDKYEYDLVEYINAHSLIKIKCKIHGEFSQRPHAHINLKQGCPKCGLANRKLPHKKTTAQFIEQAQKKWGDKYDYTNTIYIGKDIKLTYQCSKHGEVSQKPNLHLKSGCPYCNGRGIHRHSGSSFITLAKQVHEDKYDYSQMNFKSMSDYIDIICPKHGEFRQRAGNHIHLSNGCPQCSSYQSKEEKEVVNFVNTIYSGDIVLNDRKILRGVEVDILIPEFNLGIEYHGLYFHNELVVGRKYHYKKWLVAKQNNLRLLQFYSNEWHFKQELVKSKIKNFLGLSHKIYGRNTTVKFIEDIDLKNKFLTQNHLQGADNAPIVLGLFLNDSLVSCMTFGASRFNKAYKYELVRFCSLKNCVVIGGASKLLKFFLQNYPTGNIVTYADKRYSEGNLYYSLGFKLDGESQPSFSYYEINSGLLYNRMKFQKYKLTKNPNYSVDKTAYEIMQLSGFERVWDAGQYRFVLER